MQMNDSATDAATQYMIDNQLPGLPAGYDYSGNATYVTPAPTGVTPDNVAPITLTPVQQAILNAPVSPADAGSSSFWSQLPSIITGGISAYQAIQLQNLQADLIRQGKPPLTAYQLAQMRPTFGVGIAPDTQNMLVMLAIGGGALILLTSLMKHRRRGA